ncbi:MAG: PhnD/SsuA/transferrin family substrate-binding protein [Anaerosomatales bacterium]|nr:PhnD/SsuA/transferrin family substrate-binding protein [Anaerosomatales bacterium]
MNHRAENRVERQGSPGRASTLHRIANRWLTVAVLSTVAAGVFSAHLLIALLHEVSTEPLEESEAGREGEGEVRLAMGRTPGGQAEWANYVVLTEWLSERIDRPVQLRYLTDREAAVEAFESGQVDAGFVCTRSYLTLQAEGIVRPVAVPVTSGATTETAMLLVRGDSEIASAEGLEGRTAAISSKTSVTGAGYLYWLAERQGWDVESRFAELIVCGTQEEALDLLADGAVDCTVGCMTEVADYPAGTFRALAESPPYVLPPFVVTTSLDPALADAITEALLAFDAGAMLPPGSVLGGFEPVSAQDYAFARDLMAHVPEGLDRR